MSRTALLASVIALSGLGLSSTACTDSDGAIFILQNQVPEAGCVIPSDITSPFLPRGRIDVQSSTGYLFNPLVQNNATVVETANRIALVEGAEVDITLPSATELEGIDSSLTSFTSRFSGAIQPGGGLTSFSFEIMSKDLLDAIKPGTTDNRIVAVQASVKIFGEMGGGTVETNSYSYTIDVCDGCMTQNLGACTALADTFVATEGGLCNPSQDIVLQCCTKSDMTVQCPASFESIAVR